MTERLADTEAEDETTRGLDMLETEALVAALIGAQRRALDAVAENAGGFGRVVEAIVDRIHQGGKVHYIGAGTSGRLAVLDAAEMPPTFGTPRDLICAHIAGGERALREAIEGAEDDAVAGASEIENHVNGGDAVIGISASGGAPYVVAAIETARRRGAFTAAIVNSEGSPLAAAAEIGLVLRTGAEAIAGSTRMKAGTAQKIALNTISTAVMVRLGKVHGNLMVDVVATNEKLRARATRLVRAIAGVSTERASTLLAQANGSVKVAIVIALRNVDAAQARDLLAQQHGRLRPLL
ncbi:MAG TPA: N-acetylmuramic acid 6-phosphate etherase [Candidatus Baltobacteraceae bacterium]|jgi:N-acetylmuramic acid 6-phosphate etherase|nr:N-acetylmuramic acid 6-phosphate etherase [Candidatus Baltobacteraceae bacterium]